MLQKSFDFIGRCLSNATKINKEAVLDIDVWGTHYTLFYHPSFQFFYVDVCDSALSTPWIYCYSSQFVDIL